MPDRSDDQNIDADDEIDFRTYMDNLARDHDLAAEKHQANIENRPRRRKRSGKHQAQAVQRQKTQLGAAKRAALIALEEYRQVFVVLCRERGIAPEDLSREVLVQLRLNRSSGNLPPDVVKLMADDIDVQNAFHNYYMAAVVCTDLGVRASMHSMKSTDVQKIMCSATNLLVRTAESYASRIHTVEQSLQNIHDLSIDEIEVMIEESDSLAAQIAHISHRLARELEARKSRLGGLGRNKSFQPIRDHAYTLARTRAPGPNKQWPSRRQAVLAIKSEVLESKEAKEVGLSEQQAEKTIDKWLKEMPEADTLFTGKRGMLTGIDGM